MKFYGFVTAYPAVAALGLIDFLERVAPELAAACKVELAPLTSDFTAELFGQLSDDRREKTFACIARVLAAFGEHGTNWIAATGALEWHLGRLHATVLDQAARFVADPRSADHDRAMAENVLALMDSEGPDAKAVLWSHNVHAQRVAWSEDERSMGKYLDEMIGRAQVAVGFSFDRGSFQARAYPSGELIDHAVKAAEPTSFDGVLAQAKLPLFALDLVNAPRDGAVGAWLSSKTAMRKIGGVYRLPKDPRYGVTYTSPITPRDYFDALFLVAQTSPARRNHAIAPIVSLIARSAPANLELLGDGIPAAWQAVEGARKHPYAIAVSEHLSPRGERTVCVSRDAPWRWGTGQLIQKIAARPWHGKRVRFVGSIRTMATDCGAGALLFVKFLRKPDGDDEFDFLGTEIFTAASAERPEQSSQWATFAAEADVPSTADSFVVGLAVTGNGTAWFGDLEFAGEAASQG